MFQLSNQYNELLSFYKQMAENGYHRNDGAFVEKVYSDAEPHKFVEQIKKIVAPYWDGPLFTGVWLWNL